MSLNAYALTTVNRLADFIGLAQPAANSTEETVLQAIINSVTDWIENYCGRRFLQTAYSNELYDGNKSESLILKNFPVSSSASFTLQERQSSDNEDDWDTVDAEDYFIDYNAGIVRLATGAFLRGKFNYRASYTAGYNFDNTATFLSDVGAADLEYAVWRLGATAWERRQGSTGIQSESIGDYRVVYAKEAFGNEEILEVLNKYRKLEAGSYQTPVNT